jgi:effector-binding domain-containing protein
MSYQIRLENVPARPTAVDRRRAKQEALSRAIPQACGDVWAFHRANPLPGAGRHVALYLDCEVNFECGVEVARAFNGNDEVFCSNTPAGPVAMTEHRGPFHLLGAAHAAIRAWCAAEGHRPAGPNWEVYGHGDADPSQIVTEVYYLLRGEGETPS